MRSRIRLFWCGDDCFRGCVLRNMFGTAYRVLIPSVPPNTSSGKLPKHGSIFPLIDATNLALSHGCSELELIDKTWNVSRNARGDIDLAIELSNDVALVAEVKTRLISQAMKRHGLEIAKLFLQYHLDEPSKANEAWSKLVQQGIINPYSRNGRRYDNPASIAELVRSVLGFMAMHSSRYRKLVVGAVTLCNVNPLRESVLEFLRRTRTFLERCGVSIAGHCLLIVTPDSFSGIPKSLKLSCYGDGCKLLDAVIDREYPMNKLLSGCPEYRGCNECAYTGICSLYCRYCR